MVLGRGKKVNAVAFRAALMALVQRLLKEAGGNPELAEEMLKESGRGVAQYVYAAYAVEGKSLPPSCDKLPDAIARFLRWLLGRSPDAVDARREGNRLTVSFRFSECPVCGNPPFSPGVKLGAFFAGLLEWMMEQKLDEWAAERVSCGEVSCLAKGGEACEWEAVVVFK